MKDNDDVPIPFKPRHVYEDLPSVTIYGNGRKYKAHRCDVQDPEVLIRTIVNHGEAAKVLNVVSSSGDAGCGLNGEAPLLASTAQSDWSRATATASLRQHNDHTKQQQDSSYILMDKHSTGGVGDKVQRFDMIHKLAKWFPRTGNPDVNDDIFTQVQIRNWMFTKQPAKHQQTLNAMPHVSYQDMEVAELCKYFDKLQRDEIRETARRRAQEETQRKRRNKTDEDNYRARAAQGRGRRGNRGRGNGGRGNGGRGFNSRRNNVRCYKPGHNHLLIHCPENPYRVEDEEEEEETKDEEMPSEEEDEDEPMEADEEPHQMEDIGIEDLEEELESLDINDDEMEDEKKEE
ncbi:hypothetical protein MPSEU_000327500 [Mayamaea pseudoterrestris]|nr:hypothetical protein MPSEU_000327500 [Mayamaea pseudoterrestris]